MSSQKQKGSPKIVKIDLNSGTQTLKKSKRKIQPIKKKRISPQRPQTSNLITSSSPSKSRYHINKNTSPPKQKESDLVESEVQAYKVTQFSFSEQHPDLHFHHKNVKKIQGPGYEIVWDESRQRNINLQQKIGYLHVNVVRKIFQLCQKNYQFESVTFHDLEGTFSRNLIKHLKAIYGSKNQQLILKKENNLRELLKIVFYRKSALQISQLLFCMIDCQVYDQVLNGLIEFFPKQIKEF